MRGLGLGFTNAVGTVGVGVCDVCLCLGNVRGSGSVAWAWEGGCRYICVCCESGLFV